MTEEVGSKYVHIKIVEQARRDRGSAEEGRMIVPIPVAAETIQGEQA